MAAAMNGPMMGSPMMEEPESELYNSTEGEEDGTQSIPKDLLPAGVKVGDHLEVTEDLGESVRVKIADMSRPAPGGKAPDEEAALY